MQVEIQILFLTFFIKYLVKEHHVTVLDDIVPN